MAKQGLGQYDQEYLQCPCFWGKTPGKYVQIVSDILSSGNVLDLGCGEGKNAIYLAKKGFDIVALDCSEPALCNFQNQLAKEERVLENVEIIRADARTFETRKKFDLVIAYGLLHCLPSVQDALTLVNRIKQMTRVNGYNIVVTFTPELPIPAIQSYLTPTMITLSELTKWYHDWEVMQCESDIISEIHPTSKISHKHSLCRLLARRPSN